MGVVAGIAVSLVTRRLLLRRFATAKLEELWKGATETMMMPSETVVLAPCASDEESRASFLPQGPPCELCFALTAFDPPGVERSREENARENEKMWKELRGLEPKARWVGYGCDLDEGWREDGFFLEFDPADAEAARARILEVARAFDQGAIYDSRWTPRHPCAGSLL
ncbi:hypothetical protein CTAYLR_008047 [Chrysophaeum taylorii]|uniref:Uncharacterized protein n=1 Tax=Chrysophaeum taylorii TaxID=2483200 RepID=A0AAD7U757_9STRA|nr:hypothetical protein CTAYLR_008047 [Chrysophaeum taylorii]